MPAPHKLLNIYMDFTECVRDFRIVDGPSEWSSSDGLSSIIVVMIRMAFSLAFSTIQFSVSVARINTSKIVTNIEALGLRLAS